jgi:hypothetical protein
MGVVLINARCGGHDLPWRAKPALKPIALHKGLLNGMQLPTLCHAFDRRYFAPLRHGRQSQAGKHPLSIDMNRARAASSVIASLFRSSQIQMVS